MAMSLMEAWGDLNGSNSAYFLLTNIKNARTGCPKTLNEK